jgi:phosphate uptake regulator
MEKHIFKFGETSLAMIIPKKWADKNGVGASSKINVIEGNAGELTIYTSETKQPEIEKIVSKSMNPNLLGRWVGLHYMFGTSKLRLLSKDGITPQQLGAIEQRLNNDCSGFEITGQSNNDIIIEGLTNIREVDLEKIILRIRYLIDAEFNEITKGNPKSIKEIEKRVNRFYMLGMRYLNVIQPKDYARYIGLFNMLEAISDNMEAISKAMGPKQNVNSIFNVLQSQFGECLIGFKGNDKSIEEAASLRVEAIKKISRMKVENLQQHLIVEIADYISNIAEYGLNAERERDTF